MRWGCGKKFSIQVFEVYINTGYLLDFAAHLGFHYFAIDHLRRNQDDGEQQDEYGKCAGNDADNYFSSSIQRLFFQVCGSTGAGL